MKKFKNWLKTKNKKEDDFHDIPFVGFIKKHLKIINKKSKKTDLKEQKKLPDLDELFPKYGDTDDINNIPDFNHVKHLNKLNHHNERHRDLINAVHDYTGDSGAILNKHLLQKHKQVLNKNKFDTTKPNKNKNDDETINNFEKHLPNAIKMHSTKKDMVVHSGISFTPEYKQKSEMTLPAYTSTSLSKKVAINFANPVEHSNHVYNLATKEKVDWQLHQKHKMKMDNFLKTKDKIWDSVDINDIDEHKKQINKINDKLEKYKNKTPENIKKSVKYKHLISIHVPKGSHAIHTASHSQHETENEILFHKNIKLKIHKKPEINHEDQIVNWHANLIHDGFKKVG